MIDLRHRTRNAELFKALQELNHKESVSLSESVSQKSINAMLKRLNAKEQIIKAEVTLRKTKAFKTRNRFI